METKPFAKQRIALTCAPGGENHVGNQFIGKRPVKGSGFTPQDITDIQNYVLEHFPDIECSVLDLNQLSPHKTIQQLPPTDQASVLLLRKFIPTEVSDHIYQECNADEWDSKYYCTRRKKVLNKHKRKNICYVPVMTQEPNYEEGKGRIVDLESKDAMHEAFLCLKDVLKKSIKNPEKVELNVVEGNLYDNTKKTGIGMHGDTERTIVVCMSIGGIPEYPMEWAWYKDSKPIGDPFRITLNHGDVYIMSEKAVGTDWKYRSKYTLRHGAGGVLEAFKKSLAK